MAFDSSGNKLFGGGGHDDEVKMFERPVDGEFRQADSIKIPGGAPSGLALSADGRTLYVALNLKHAVAVIDIATRRITEVDVGNYPYTIALARGKVFVSNWGGRRARPDDSTSSETLLSICFSTVNPQGTC